MKITKGEELSHHKGGHIKYFSVKHLSAAGTKSRVQAFAINTSEKRRENSPHTLEINQIYKETPETTNPCQVVS